MQTRMVLVVDDEALIALDLECAFVDAGFAVAVARSCDEVDRFLQDHTPAAGVLDIRLSDGECSSAARTLASRKVPFVVCSGAGLDLSDDAFASGVVLSKPADPVHVVELIKSLILA